MTTQADGPKQRLLDAAERLFAERGFQATSVRDITAAAGLNPAAVNYHFASRDALLRAVVMRTIGEVSEQRRHRLEQLQAAGRPPTVTQLIDGFVSPAYELTDRYGPRGELLARLLGRAMGEPGQAIRHVLIEVAGPVERLYLDAFAAALPHLSAGELRWRWRSAIGVLFTDLSGLLDDTTSATREQPEDQRRWTITLLTAALSAPATHADTATAAKSAEVPPASQQDLSFNRAVD